jgi:long-subunit fatty acid transport protein
MTKRSKRPSGHFHIDTALPQAVEVAALAGDKGDLSIRRIFLGKHDGKGDLRLQISLRLQVDPAGRLIPDVQGDVFYPVGWSSFSSIRYDLEKEVPEAGVTDSTTDLDWKDIWTVKVGVDYKLKDNLSIRGGYAYVDSPVPLQTLEPGNPDAKQHNFSVGVGYRKGRWTLDFAYVAGFYQNRTVSNPILSGGVRELRPLRYDERGIQVQIVPFLLSGCLASGAILPPAAGLRISQSPSRSVKAFIPARCGSSTVPTSFRGLSLS